MNGGHAYGRVRKYGNHSFYITHFEIPKTLHVIFWFIVLIIIFNCRSSG
jgi:hypothetical protein